MLYTCIEKSKLLDNYLMYLFKWRQQQKPNRFFKEEAGGDAWNSLHASSELRNAYDLYYLYVFVENSDIDKKKKQQKRDYLLQCRPKRFYMSDDGHVEKRAWIFLIWVCLVWVCVNANQIYWNILKIALTRTLCAHLSKGDIHF